MSPSLSGFTEQALKKESVILVYGFLLCLHSPGCNPQCINPSCVIV